MAANDVNQRPNYFAGQYLLEDDFELEQKYHIDRQRRHNCLLHVSGIAEGLTVTKEEGKKVKVSSGTAVDTEGKQIILLNERTVHLPGNGVHTLFIKYAKKEDTPQEGTTGGNRRIVEEPDIDFKKTESAIALALLTVTEENTSNPDESVREYSGLRLPGAENSEVTLRYVGDKNSKLAILDGNLSVTGTVKATTFQGNGSELTGIVKNTGDTITGNLSVSGNLSISGNVDIGTTSQRVKLEVAGIVKATRFQGDGSELAGIVKNSGDTINGSLSVTGNVGIGKPDPGAKLEVNGNLKLQQGVAVNKFSSDGNLTDSEVSVPTEKAVKTYVSAQIAVVNQALSTKAALAGASYQNFLANNLTVSGNLTTTGNVGIGTTTPQGFQIVLPESSKPLAPNPGVTITGGKVGNANIELRNNGTGTPFIDFAIKTDTDYDARICLTEVGKLAIEGADVGIGTKLPSRKLHVVGDIYVEGNVIATGKYWSKAYGDDNKWQTIRYVIDKTWIWEVQDLPSDIQLKKDIVPINNALATVEQLQPVSFHWLDSNYFLKEVDKNLLHEAVQTEQDIEAVNQVKEKLKAKLERQQLGFIAQDVQRVFPDWVETGEDGYKKLNMTQLNAMLVQCIKELKAAHDESEAKNLDLKRRLEILEKKVN